MKYLQASSDRGELLKAELLLQPNSPQYNIQEQFMTASKIIGQYLTTRISPVPFSLRQTIVARLRLKLEGENPLGVATEIRIILGNLAEEREVSEEDRERTREFLKLLANVIGEAARSS